MAEKPPEQAALEAFLRSRHWKWFQDFLIHRRESLFHSTPKTIEELWIREGELRIVNLLLQAPHRVVEWYTEQRAAEMHASPSEREAAPARVPFTDGSDW